ncbi:MAG: penicillin-binding protein 2 [Deltaproteobacteria bacterium]
MRIGTYRIFVILMFGAAVLGLIHLQAARGPRYYELSQRNAIRVIRQEPYRGRFYDRGGRLLADNVLSFDVVIIPQELSDRQRTFARLAALLGLTAGEVERIYKKGYLNPFTPVVIAGAVPKEEAIAVAEEELTLPGVTVNLDAKRQYPYGPVTAHVLGYLSEIDRERITRMKSYGYDLKDKVGVSGLEETLDIFLRGEKGGEQIEVDSQGRKVRLIGYQPSTMGKDVTTTLDLDLQQAAYAAMQDRKGAFVMMDVRTGEVLVLLSLPSYDPNVFIDRSDNLRLGAYLTSPEAPLFNRATSGAFPPGSVFKAVTAAAALRARPFPVSMTFVCRGRLKVGDRYFKCWSTHGPQDFDQAMAHSCDVYFYHLGFRANPDGMTHMAHAFGLGELTGIELGNEVAGFIPSRVWKNLTRLENWYDGDTANFSIGQGYVMVTPLQLVRMMAAIANGGILPSPHLTKDIGGEPVVVRPVRHVGVDAESLAMVKDALRYPVSLPTGTAHELDVSGMSVCAKTGTAQVNDKPAHAWVAGFFPQEDPRVAFCVLLEHGETSHEAVAVARKVIEEGKARGKWL